MAVFSRLFQLCRADLHGVLDQLEDKGLLLKQYLREMVTHLSDKEAQLEKISQTCHRFRNDLSRREQEVDRLEKDLELALYKEKDDIAKMLIRKRRALAMGNDRIQQQLKTMEEEKDRISQKLTQQRLKYDQLKAQAVAFFHQVEQQHFEGEVDSDQSPFAWQMTTEEEIELELLQRKEALKKGGGS